MSIIVKGVEMPKKGEALLICSDGSVWAKAWPTRGYMRMREAKASATPTSHGRLIDADAIMKKVKEEAINQVKFMEGFDGRPAYVYKYHPVVMAYTDCCGKIKDAPTIIEAEQEV